MNLNTIIASLILFGILYSVSNEPRNVTAREDFSVYSEVIPGTDVSIKMIPISGGSFMMGSAKGEASAKKDEGPQRSVNVDSFWMGAYEMTWEQYELFLKEEVSDLKDLKSVDGLTIEVDGISTPTPMYMDMSFGMGKEGYPAVNMTHYAAVMYAKWLTAKTGRFYRLPTEAEWEYAARAGSSTAYYFGDNPDELDKYAWFEANSDGGYGKVGVKEPNPWGLYDMHGNVAEWTTDQYIPDYHERLEGNPSKNPWFKPTTLYPRSVRGGSWMSSADQLRSSSREGSSKTWKQRDPQMPKSIWWLTDAPFVGFRLVRPKETPSAKDMQAYWVEVMQDF